MDDGHAGKDAVGDLLLNQRLRPIGHLGSNLNTPIHGPGMHHPGLWCCQCQAFRRQPPLTVIGLRIDLDVDSCVIGDRAFSAAPAAVTDLGRYYLAGMHDAGMRTCGKHFPGHGSVRADSHTDDVLDERPLAALESTDLVPFKALLAQLDAVMMAHVCYPEVDVAPAGYSAHWIQTVLRAQCDWSGVVLSDDLGMHAAAYAGKLRDRLFRSLEAGCDAVLVCQPEEVDALLQSCANDRLPPAPALLKLHGRNRVSREELLTVSEWRHWQQSIKDLEHCQWA